MKHFLLKTWLMTLLLVVGGGSAWAEEVVYYTNSCPGSTSNSAYANYYDVTVNNIKWKAPGNQYGNGDWRIGGKGTSSVNRYLYTQTAIDKDITKIVITHGAKNAGTVGNVTLNVYSTAELAAAGATGDVSSLSTAYVDNGSITFTRPTDHNWNNRYFRFTYPVNPNSSSNKYVSIKKFEFYHDNAIVSERYNITIDKNIVGGTVTASSDKAEAGTQITLTATPNEGNALEAWHVTNASTNETIEVVNDKFTMPDADVNVSAKFVKVTVGTIKFGTNNVRISAASVTGNDDLGNTWTITTAGTTSFNQQPLYSQVGSGSNPATSITFTATLPKKVNILSLSAKFGGFSGTTGNVSLKVGEAEVGSGNLNATNDVTVVSTSEAVGRVLTVTVTGIAKGVKCYNISYTYSELQPVFNELIQPFIAQNEEDAYFATFSEENDVFMSSDATVYAISVEDWNLVMNSEAFVKETVEVESNNSVEGYWIPANTGVLLKSADALVTYYTVENKNLNPIEEAANLLRPASVPMEGDFLFYKLAYGNVNDRSTLGFWWGAPEGGAYTAKAGAYLAVPAILGANLVSGFSFAGDGETSIKAVEYNAIQKADGKYLKDGRIIIVRDGAEYDVMGMKK